MINYCELQDYFFTFLLLKGWRFFRTYQYYTHWKWANILLINQSFFFPIWKKYNKYTIFWLLTTKSLVVAKLFYWRVNSSSTYCLTNGLIFIGLISQVKLMSQCRCVVQILGLDGQGYWKHLMDMWVERVHEQENFEKKKVHNKTL